jgi:H+/gluconate symporter-like permease
MDKMVGFLKLYFPVFLLGALFGKLIELSGFSRAIVSGSLRLLGRGRAMLSIVLVCALLTYGGVSLFVVVFAVYPFAAELFRRSDIPKRLIPATIALGAFHLHHGCVAGHAADPEHHPDHLLRHRRLGGAAAGIAGAVFVALTGLAYLEWQRRRALAAGEGYGTELRNEPLAFEGGKLANRWWPCFRWCSWASATSCSR